MFSYLGLCKNRIYSHSRVTRTHIWVLTSLYKIIADFLINLFHFRLGSPGHTGEFTSFTWPRNAWPSPPRRWRRWLGRQRQGSGWLCLDCCPCDMDPDNWQKLDGWMNGWIFYTLVYDQDWICEINSGNLQTHFSCTCENPFHSFLERERKPQALLKCSRASRVSDSYRSW